MLGNTILIDISFVQQLTPIYTLWIMYPGTWNDLGLWIDAATWKDDGGY